MTSLGIAIAIIVAYVAILLIATYAAHPYRLRLVRLVDDMLGEQHWTPVERATLKVIAQSSGSTSAGLLLPFAALFSVAAMILQGGETTSGSLPNLNTDPRKHDIVRLQLRSLVGGSPFAALIAGAIASLGYLVLVMRGDQSPRRAFEAPIREVWGAQT